MSELSPESPKPGQRLLHWLLILGFFFASYLAVLPWMPFNDGMENFNVLTSLEIARGGNWIIPTLWQLPRLEKPPLAQWLTALGILGGGDITVAARWPALLLTCCTLVVIYEWGRLLHSARAGIVGAIAAGTNILFLRFGKRASYDGQLLFWDALANLAFTWGLLYGQWLRGMLLGGVALGLALLTKGPPALLHTVVPCAAWAIGIAIWRGRDRDRGLAEPIPLSKALIMLLGAVVLATAIALPWAMAAVAQLGGWEHALAFWRDRVTLAPEQEEGLRTNPLHGLIFFGLLMPWLGWILIAGLVARRGRAGGRGGEGGRGRGQARHIWFLVVLMVVPVAIHAFLPIARPRYFLPMVAPAAVIVGIVYCDYLERARAARVARVAGPTPLDRLLLAIQYAVLLALVVGYPLASVHDVPSDGEVMPGLGWSWALILAGVGLAIVVVAIVRQQRWPMALPIATAMGMMLYNGVYTWHEHGSPNQSEQAMAEVRQQFPNARFYCLRRQPPQRELAIYLGRSVQAVDGFEQVPQGATAGGPHLLILREDARVEPPPGWAPAMHLTAGDRPYTLWQPPARAGDTGTPTSQP